nr:hypothetical protein [Tanacetum cinerariifolium]
MGCHREWKLICARNSFMPVTQTTTAEGGDITTTILSPVTAKEKIKKKNDVKAKSMLLMAPRNEHLLTFNQYKDAKSLFAAIETRFGGNKATKKTRKTLLKQFTNNTNEVSTAYGVSTASTQSSTTSTKVSTGSSQTSTTNLSDVTVYAFLANQSNRSQLVHEDLKQIHEDDLEEMDLKWQLALLSIRAKRFFQKTRKKITINGSDTSSFDKSNVECDNCHKMGYFARECKGPRNQDSRNRYQDRSRRTVHAEETPLKAMVAIDGVEFNKSEFNLATYKRGIASVEEQFLFYKKNEVLFSEQITVLKRDISFKHSEISVLKSELEKLKQEKESNQFKIENFDNASKSLEKLIGSQISKNSKKGLGYERYNVVSPPPTGLSLPPKPNLSNSGLEEFQQPELEGFGPKTSKSVCK